MELFAILVFGATAAFYTMAAVAHLLNMFRRDFALLAQWSSRSAWLVQTLGLLLLVFLTGRFPVYTLFEFAYFFSWLMVTNYIVIEVLRNDQTAGSFLMPVIAILLVFSDTLENPAATMVVSDFPGSLIVWHVMVTMLGYAFFTASFVAGALYLLQERNLRRKSFGPLYYRLPPLETLDIWSGRFVYVGFPLLTIGMGAGFVFAHVTWSTWHADPKVLFTVLVWLVYGGYLLMRKLWGWGGRTAAWWSVVGVTGLLINYFVVNLLSRLHRFGV